MRWLFCCIFGSLALNWHCNAQILWLGINSAANKNTNSSFLLRIDTHKAQLTLLNQESELFSSRVTAIALNESGDGYVTTDNGNVYHYEHMQRHLIREHYLFGIRAIAAANRYVWFGGRKNLIRCNIDKLSNCTVIDHSIENISGMSLDDTGSGWVITQNGRLHRYKNEEYVETTTTINTFPQALKIDTDLQKIVIDSCSNTMCTNMYQIYCSTNGTNCSSSL